MTNPFTCDSNAKQIAGRALISWGRKYGCTIKTAATENDTDRVDITYTAITPSNKERYGIIEVKERWNIRPGYYDNEYVNPEKLDNPVVNGYRSSGWTYLWCAVYRDANEYIFWNTEDAVKDEETTLISTTTVMKGIKVPQVRFHLDFDRAKIRGKIRDLNDNG